MSFHIDRYFIVFAAASAALTGAALPGAVPLAHANMSQEMYSSALKIAEKKVQRSQSLSQSSTAGALSSSMIKALYGRYYQVGDHWDVAAWHYNTPMMRMTSDPQHLETKAGQVGIFHYEVTAVKPGTQPQVVIQVTQLSQYGLAPVDPRVAKLTLTMNDSMLQSRKTYTFDDSPREIPVSPDGLHSSMTILELFPLDVPDVVTAEHQSVSALPELPEGLKSVASTAGYRPDLAQSLWFEQDDFFGRAVQILWQHGDPWPSYVKTANGVAILIGK